METWRVWAIAGVLVIASLTLLGQIVPALGSLLLDWIDVRQWSMTMIVLFHVAILAVLITVRSQTDL